jgi:hypothetical protein
MTGAETKTVSPTVATSEKTTPNVPAGTDMANASTANADAAPPAPVAAPAEAPETMKTPEASATAAAEMTAPPTPAAPAADSAPVAQTAPAALPPPMTPIHLTKPTEVKLAFGKLVLATGTVVKFVAQEGPWLRVQFNKDTIYVPATSTNVNDLAPAPAPAAEPGLMPAPPTPTAPDPLAPPKPAKDSLFGDLPTPTPPPPAPPL